MKHTIRSQMRKPKPQLSQLAQTLNIIKRKAKLTDTALATALHRRREHINLLRHDRCGSSYQLRKAAIALADTLHVKLPKKISYIW